MDEIITVTLPELPAAAQIDGSELIAVWQGERLSKVKQAAGRSGR